MTSKNPEIRATPPSHSAHVVQGLCMALSDMLNDEGAKPSRRTYLKMCALATAAEMLSRDVTGFFSGQAGEAEALLEQVEKLYVADDRERAALSCHA